MTAVPLPFQAEPAPPLAVRAPAFAAVLAMHATLMTCALHMRVDPRPERAPIPLDMRIIEAPASAPQGAPKTADRQAPRIARRVMRPPQPIAPPPVPAIAANAGQPSPAVAAAPLPAALPSEEAVAVAAPSVPAPAAVAVTAPRFDADYLLNPPPPYPAMSRRLREAGKVSLLVKVTAQGEPEHVEIREGSGFPRLDEAALITVQRWRFVPARKGDAAVSASVVVPIVFHLDS